MTEEEKREIAESVRGLLDRMPQPDPPCSATGSSSAKVLGMRRQDYFGQGSRGCSGSTRRAGSGTTSRPTTGRPPPSTSTSRRPGSTNRRRAFFQSVDPPAGRRLTGRALERRVVLATIKRRAASAGLLPSTCCHAFRATRITAYLSNGGTPEHAPADRRSRQGRAVRHRTFITALVCAILHVSDHAPEGNIHV